MYNNNIDRPPASWSVYSGDVALSCGEALSYSSLEEEEYALIPL